MGGFLWVHGLNCGVPQTTHPSASHPLYMTLSTTHTFFTPDKQTPHLGGSTQAKCIMVCDKSECVELQGSWTTSDIIRLLFLVLTAFPQHIKHTAVRDPWHGSPSVVQDGTKQCMWDDDMINKPCVQLLGLILHGIGSVTAKRERERKRSHYYVFVCVCVHSCRRHVVCLNVWFWLVSILGSRWKRVNLKGRARPCDVFPPSVDRWRLQWFLPPHLHHCLSSPLPALLWSPLCSAQSCVCLCVWEKDRKRDMKRTCVRRRRCASPCTLMALHTAARVPGFDTVRGGC